MLPNFLIVGAAKAGTTSLFEYLGEHPQIFTPAKKEPKFFSYGCYPSPLKGPGDDLVESQIVKNFDEYKKLFDNSDAYPLRGEASPDSLYYWNGAIPKIKKILGDVKIIIMIRNPANRAFSNYMHLIRDGRETLNFEAALDAEEYRINQNYEFFWHYRACGMLSDAVYSYCKEFTNVKIIIFEEWIKNLNEEMGEIYQFLGVDYYPFASMGQVHNESGIPKNLVLQRIIHPKGFSKKVIRGFFKTIRLYSLAKMLRNKLRSANLDKSTKINPITYERLMSFYENDIIKLESCLERPIKLWKI